MTPATFDFTTWVGDTVRQIVTLTLPDPAAPDDTTKGIPLALTGATAAAQARAKKTDSTAVAEFTCNIIDAENGKVQLYLPASKAEKLTEGKFFWDLQITWPVKPGEDEGDVNTYLAGVWTVTQDVTKVSRG